MRLIVTAGRAGSSFLATQLNNHPDVACLNETHYLPLVIDEVGEGRASAAEMLQVVDRVRFHDGRVVFESNFAALGIVQADWAAWRSALIEDGSDMTVAEFQAHVEEFVMARTGTSIVIDKTPCYGADLARFATHFAPLTVINLTRDVDRSVASMLKHPGFLAKVRLGTTTWTDVIRHHNVTDDDLVVSTRPGEPDLMRRLWAWRSVEPLRQAEQAGIEVVNVRYEDLLAEPPEVLARILEIFRIPRNDEWLSSAAAAVRQPPAAPSDPDQGAGAGSRLQHLSSAYAVTRARHRLGYLDLWPASVARRWSARRFGVRSPGAAGGD